MTNTPNVEKVKGGDSIDLIDEPEVDEGKTQLKKNVSLASGTALIVGTMIGSGIFISPKGVLEGTGSVGFSLIIWALCGVLSTMGALVYAELGTCIPRSGGEHAYLMYAFGSNGGIGRLPAFLFDWVGLFILRPCMFTIMTMSLGKYVVKPFFPTCVDPPDLPVKLVTVLAMLILAAINSFSVPWATRLQNVTTVTKLGAIFIISIGGLYHIIAVSSENVATGFEGTTEDPSLIAIAFYNGLWAYDGWNNLNFITEELKDPDKNLPRAIMLGIPSVMLAYLLANVGYFAVMSTNEILVSHAVAVTWSNYMLGVMAWIMPVFVVLSCLGSANGCIFSTGRLCFAAARDKHFPSILSGVQVNRLTPMPSIIFTTLVGIITVIPGDLSTLIDFYSFSLWLFYGATTVALLYLRFKEPDLKRPYKVPLVIPIIVLVMSFYLTISPIVQTGRVTFFYAILFILSGLFIYVPFVHRRYTLPYMDSIHIYLQKLLLVEPTKSE